MVKACIHAIMSNGKGRFVALLLWVLLKHITGWMYRSLCGAYGAGLAAITSNAVLLTIPAVPLTCITAASTVRSSMLANRCQVYVCCRCLANMVVSEIPIGCLIILSSMLACSTMPGECLSFWQQSDHGWTDWLTDWLGQSLLVSCNEPQLQCGTMCHSWPQWYYHYAWHPSVFVNSQQHLVSQAVQVMWFQLECYKRWQQLRPVLRLAADARKSAICAVWIICYACDNCMFSLKCCTSAGNWCQTEVGAPCRYMANTWPYFSLLRWQLSELMNAGCFRTYQTVVMVGGVRSHCQPVMRGCTAMTGWWLLTKYHQAAVEESAAGMDFKTTLPGCKGVYGLQVWLTVYIRGCCLDMLCVIWSVCPKERNEAEDQ